MDTIIIVLPVIIVIILAYFVMHDNNDNSTTMAMSVVPSPNTYSNSLPNTTEPLTTKPPVVLQQVKLLVPEYPLDDAYYYDPSYYYDPYPYWWGGWGGWYGGSGSYGYRDRYHRRHNYNGHRRPSSGEIVHGGMRPGGHGGHHH
jgi:hypothetical protein